jgi:hypothetical protein
VYGVRLHQKQTQSFSACPRHKGKHGRHTYSRSSADSEIQLPLHASAVSPTHLGQPVNEPKTSQTYSLARFASRDGKRAFRAEFFCSHTAQAKTWKASGRKRFWLTRGAIPASADTSRTRAHSVTAVIACWPRVIRV